MEILITIVIFLFAFFIIFKNIKKSSKGGGCSCNSCSDSCPMKKNNETNSIKFKN